MEKPATLQQEEERNKNISRIIKPTLPDFTFIQSKIQEISSMGMINSSKFVSEFETAFNTYMGVQNAVGNWDPNLDELDLLREMS